MSTGCRLDRTAQIQRVFRTTLLNPPNEPPLPSLENTDGIPCGISRMVVAYHRPRNLGNVLAPRRLHKDGVSVSSILAELQNIVLNPNPIETLTDD